MISLCWDDADLNTAACCRKYSLLAAFFKALGFPIPYSRDVVSQPDKAWTNRRCSQTLFPRNCCVCTISQHLAGFRDPDLGSDLKNTLNVGLFALLHKSTRRSVSSPMSTVSCWVAWARVVWTISTSASAAACWTVQPYCSSSEASIFMNLCLLTVLERNSSFFKVHTMSPVNWTVGAILTFARRPCVASLVVGPEL